MLKLIGTSLIFCFSVMLGFNIANNEKRKQSNNRKLFDSMLKTKMLLNYSKTDKKKVMEKIDFEYFVDCNSKGKIDNELFNIAKKYFDDMGSRDFKTESESLNFILNDIEARLNPLSEKCRQNIKLSITMGILCALFFVIIVL